MVPAQKLQIKDYPNDFSKAVSATGGNEPAIIFLFGP